MNELRNDIGRMGDQSTTFVFHKADIGGCVPKSAVGTMNFFKTDSRARQSSRPSPKRHRTRQALPHRVRAALYNLQPVEVTLKFACCSQIVSKRKGKGWTCHYIFLKFAISKSVCLSWGGGSKVLARTQECYFNGAPFTLEGNLKSRKGVTFWNSYSFNSVVLNQDYLPLGKFLL